MNPTASFSSKWTWVGNEAASPVGEVFSAVRQTSSAAPGRLADGHRVPGRPVGRGTMERCHTRDSSTLEQEDNREQGHDKETRRRDSSTDRCPGSNRH